MIKNRSKEIESEATRSFENWKVAINAVSNLQEKYVSTQFTTSI